MMDFLQVPKQFRRREKNRMNARLKRDKRYWRRVWESDGFDIDHLEGKGPSYGGLQIFKSEDVDFPVLVTLYAKIGLHWYNLQKGTNLQLHHIEKYNSYSKSMPSSYFITLVAEDPATGSHSTFQTCLEENECHSLDVRYDIARLKPKETKPTLFWGRDPPEFLDVSNPEWPSNVDPFNDRDRYYVVRESQWDDWIRLYLDLAFVSTNRFIHNLKLSDLKILKVAVETEENVELLKVAGDATVYIMYERNSGEGVVVNGRAIVRRTVHLPSGRFSLIGYTLDSPE